MLEIYPGATLAVMRNVREKERCREIEDESGRVLNAQSTKMWRTATKSSSHHHYRFFHGLEVDFLLEVVVKNGDGIPMPKTIIYEYYTR